MEFKRSHKRKRKKGTLSGILGNQSGERNSGGNPSVKRKFKKGDERGDVGDGGGPQSPAFKHLSKNPIKLRLVRE